MLLSCGWHPSPRTIPTGRTARRSNQSVLKEINPEYSLEGLMPILWPSDVKSSLTGKDPNAGKDWGQGEKAVTEDEMVGWHHWLSGHKFQQALENSEGQGSLSCSSSRGHKGSDVTEWLNNNKRSSRNTCWTLVALLYMKVNSSTAQQLPKAASNGPKKCPPGIAFSKTGGWGFANSLYN